MIIYANPFNGTRADIIPSIVGRGGFRHAENSQIPGQSKALRELTVRHKCRTLQHIRQIKS